MSSLYHPRGFWHGLVRQPAWHLREFARNPAYRALHRFHRQLRRLPRRTVALVEYQGHPIRLCDAPSFLSAWDEIFVNRIYQVAAPGGTVPCLVDAGANIGLAALYWKLRFDRFEYIGFEPDPVVAACCRENLRAWGIAGEVHEVALGAADGRASFHADHADGGRLGGDHPGGAATRVLEVAVRRLSTYLPATVDLLKIDVEGAESEILADIEPSLGRVRALFMEWHGRAGAGGLGPAIGRLEAAGFDCIVQVAVGPREPFLAPRPEAGWQQNLNLYAVRQ